LQILTAYILANHQAGHAGQSLGLFSLLCMWVGALSMNIYVVGINQIQDVEIDRINKPDLPLAAGEFSIAVGKKIVLIAGILSLATLPFLSFYFASMVIAILLIGTCYSLPPFHLKNSPVGAALAIACARGLIFNIGLFLHFSYSMGAGTILPFPVKALALFIFGFCIVIAIMKDIPDIKGDESHGIRTLAVRAGPALAFNLSLIILGLCYFVFIFYGVIRWSVPDMAFFAVSHILVLAALVVKSVRVDIKSPSQIYRYYMLLWKMFYLEFIIFIIVFGLFPYYSKFQQ
jgi:homogentisate phytyltransferase / homogentisate geranylgeranyltransferase